MTYVLKFNSIIFALQYKECDNSSQLRKYFKEQLPVLVCWNHLSTIFFIDCWTIHCMFLSRFVFLSENN